MITDQCFECKSNRFCKDNDCGEQVFSPKFTWLKFPSQSKLAAIMLTDFSYAFRTLRKSPVFTITVVVTIALAIGASTAIFSVTNGVLLRKLPYKDPERLVLVRGDL